MEKLIHQNSGRRKTVFIEELKSNLRKISVVSKNETFQRARMTLAKEDNLVKEMKNQNSPNENSDHDGMANFLTNEVENWKSDLLSEYLNIVDKLQKEIEESEIEKTFLLAQKNELGEKLKSMSGKFKILIEDYSKLERNLNDHMSLADLRLHENQILLIEMRKLKEEKLKTEKKMSVDFEITKVEFERRIEQLENSIKRILNERDFLFHQKTISDNSHVSNEEYQQFQKERIDALNAKIDVFRNENEFLKMKIVSSKEEIGDLQAKIIQKNKVAGEMKIKCAEEMEDVFLACQQKIKKLEEKNNSIGDNAELTTRFTELFARDFTGMESIIQSTTKPPDQTHVNPINETEVLTENKTIKCNCNDFVENENFVRNTQTSKSAITDFLNSFNSASEIEDTGVHSKNCKHDDSEFIVNL